MDGSEEDQKLFCIHDPRNDAPSPFNQYQNVQIQHDDIRAFLYEFFENTNKHIIKDADLLDSITDALLNDLADSPERFFYSDHFTITIPMAGGDRLAAVPADASVSGQKALFDLLFGRLIEECPWSTFTEMAKQTPDFRWMNELQSAIMQIARRERFEPPQATALDRDRRARYRPILHRVDYQPDGRLECEVLLVHDVVGQWEGVPKSQAALLTSIRLAIRLRYELLREFQGNVTKQISKLGPKEFREQIRAQFVTIEQEADSRGLFDKDLVVGAFQREDIRQRVAAMFTEYGSIRNNIFDAVGMSPEPSVWTEFDDEPLSDAAIQTLEAELKKLDALNAEYLRYAADEQALVVNAL